MFEWIWPVTARICPCPPFRDGLWALGEGVLEMSLLGLHTRLSAPWPVVSFCVHLCPLPRRRDPGLRALGAPCIEGAVVASHCPVFTVMVMMWFPLPLALIPLSGLSSKTVTQIRCGLHQLLLRGPNSPWEAPWVQCDPDISLVPISFFSSAVKSLAFVELKSFIPSVSENWHIDAWKSQPSKVPGSLALC